MGKRSHGSVLNGNYAPKWVTSGRNSTADEVSDDEVDLDQIEAEEEKEAPIKGRRALRVSESVQIVKESHYPDINKCECGCNLKFAPGWVTTESHIVPEHVLIVEHTYYQGFCGRETCKQSGPVSRKTHRHIMKGCKLSLASVLTLVGQKYHEHSTMTRAGNRMRSNGLEHADSTLNRSIIHVAKKGFKKLYEEISNNVNSGPIVHADETPIKVRRQGEAKERGKGKCDKFYLYALLRDERKWNPDARPLVAFHFRTSRSADTISSLLSGTAIKILHIDGYAGYNCLFQDGDMLAARCWAHTRRYFEKAKESPLARRVLKLIAQMYTIEKATAFLTFAEREAIRMAKTLPLIDAIESQIVQAQSLAAGYLSTAINYALGAMNDLKRLVFDGRLEIDNNPVERCIRGIAVTRKNSLYAGSIPSAEAWAIYFTLIESAKLNGVDPMAYLQWAGHEIDRHKGNLDYSTLMPWLCPIGRNRAKPAAA